MVLTELHRLEERLPPPPARRSLHSSLSSWLEGTRRLAQDHATRDPQGRHLGLGESGLEEQLRAGLLVALSAMRTLGWDACELMEKAYGRRFEDVDGWVRFLPPTAPGCEDPSCGEEAWIERTQDLLSRGDVLARQARTNAGDPQVREAVRLFLAESLAFCLRSARNLVAEDESSGRIWAPLLGPAMESR